MNSSAAFWRGTLKKAMETIGGTVNLMEVCGSHSLAIAKFGLRALLPEGLRLLSGPGCPVCVSGVRFIDNAIALSRNGIKVAVFGDLLRIPGSEGTLQNERELLVIYSPEEALDYAKAHPAEEVVLAAVGFDPTLCAGAAVLEEARKSGAENFSMLADFKRIRPVLDDLAHDPKTKLNGFILPGHVASVTGEQGFAGLSLPGVISGFTAENILHSIFLLLQLTGKKETAVINNYPQMVSLGGNRTALELIGQYFEPVSGEWRGIGIVDGGCWKIREEYARFDASVKYHLENTGVVRSPAGCRCGDVLRGYLRPAECPLFAKQCTPEHPVGACMVSGEGACAAFYRYREWKAC